MTTTTAKATSRTITRRTSSKIRTVVDTTPPWTMEERLRRIEAMSLRINGFIQFMCQVAKLSGTSAEAKERAVTAFYEQMVVVESQLGRIQEELQLG
jgi:hypothetical protein